MRSKVNAFIISKFFSLLFCLVVWWQDCSSKGTKYSRSSSSKGTKYITRIFCFCDFNLILLFLWVFNISPQREIYTNKTNGYLKDARRASLFLVLFYHWKFGEMKSSLLKYVLCSCWTYLREIFHTDRARQLTTRTTVSWLYSQNRQKCSGWSCSLHKFVLVICLMKYQSIQFVLFS